MLISFDFSQIRKVYYNINEAENKEDSYEIDSEENDELVCSNEISELPEKLENSGRELVVYETVETPDQNYIIEFVNEETPKINISVLPKIAAENKNIEGDSLLPEITDSVEKRSKKSKTPSPGKSLTSILKCPNNNPDEDLRRSTRPKKQVTFNLPTPSKSRALTRTKSFVYEKPAEITLQKKFYQIFQTFECRYLEAVGFTKTKNIHIFKIYRYTRAIDIYTHLLKKRIVLTKVSKSTIAKKMSTESDRNQKEEFEHQKRINSESSNDEEPQDPVDEIVIKQEVVYDGYQEHPKDAFSRNTKEEPVSEPSESEKDEIDPHEDEILDSQKSSDPGGSNRIDIGQSKLQEPAKEQSKLKKAISEEYSRRIMKKLEETFHLITENVKNDEYYLLEQDSAFAYNYFEHVLKTFHENGDDDMFEEFHNILKTFDASFESVPELYHVSIIKIFSSNNFLIKRLFFQKMENFLMPKYPELLNLFLSFLLPEHASEIGKFFEHFILTNMTTLLEKLNFYFKQQPSHVSDTERNQLVKYLKTSHLSR